VFRPFFVNFFQLVSILTVDAAVKLLVIKENNTLYKGTMRCKAYKKSDVSDGKRWHGGAVNHPTLTLHVSKLMPPLESIVVSFLSRDWWMEVAALLLTAVPLSTIPLLRESTATSMLSVVKGIP
jgi:hypothetical protein